MLYRLAVIQVLNLSSAVIAAQDVILGSCSCQNSWILYISQDVCQKEVSLLVRGWEREK